MIRDNYVVVAGTFDLFHIGHLRLLERASEFGRVIAMVNTDRFVETYKSPTVIPEQDRISIVESIDCVDFVLYNDNADLKETIEPLLFDFNVVGIVFGDDYDIKKYRKQTKITPEWQDEHNIALIQFPRTPQVSSSKLRESIKTKSPNDK